MSTSMSVGQLGTTLKARMLATYVGISRSWIASQSLEKDSIDAELNLPPFVLAGTSGGACGGARGGLSWRLRKRLGAKRGI